MRGYAIRLMAEPFGRAKLPDPVLQEMGRFSAKVKFEKTVGAESRGAGQKQAAWRNVHQENPDEKRKHEHSAWQTQNITSVFGDDGRPCFGKLSSFRSHDPLPDERINATIPLERAIIVNPMAKATMRSVFPPINVWSIQSRTP